jgi:DNA polymerase-3 subunit delta'
MRGLFNKVFGHDKAKELFIKAFENNKLTSTYLFKGPSGIGKKLFAKTTAAMLNCHNKDIAPCGSCIGCMKVENGIHVDVLYIEAEKDNILVEQVEPVIEKAQFPPFEGNARIFIIDNAHLLNVTAGNMLLKTLEEPKDNNYFFLITDKPDLILPTIRSRSQEITFRSEDLANHLTVTGMDMDSIYPYVAMGGGFTKSREDIEEFAFFREKALKLIIAMTNNDDFLEIEEDIQDFFSEKKRDDTDRFFEIINMLIRDLLVIKAKREEKIYNSDFTEKLKIIANYFTADSLFSLLKTVRQTKTNLYYNIRVSHLVTILITEGRKVLR